MASIGKFDAMCLHVVTAWRMLFCAGDVHCPCPCAPSVQEIQSVVVVCGWFGEEGGVCVCGNILVSNPLHATVSL